MGAQRVMGPLVALHLGVFVVVNAALALLALASWPGLDVPPRWWPFPAVLIWAAALVMHWANDLIERTHRVR